MKKTISILLILTLLLSVLTTTGCFGRRETDTALEKLELAIKYLSEDNFEQAILAFHAVLEIDPRNVQAYTGLAGAYVLQGEPEKAQQILAQGLAEVEAEEQPKLKLSLAGVLLDTGETAQAEEILKELTQVTPLNLPAHRAYKNMLLQQNRSAEALQLLITATEKDDVPHQIYTMLAEIHLRNNDKQKALAAIQQSLAINPEQATAYQQLAEIFQNEPSNLIAWGREQNEQHLSELAELIANYIKGNYTVITNNFPQLAEKTRTNSWATIILAKAYLELGENEQALQVLNTINTAQITCAALLAEIATHYFALGETEKATQLAEKGIEIDNTIAANFILLYRIYKETDEAQAMIWLARQLLNSPHGFIVAKEMQAAEILAAEQPTVTPEEEPRESIEEKPEPEPEIAYDSNAPFSFENEFDIVWHVGGTRIDFGMTKKEIRERLGEPQAVEEIYCEASGGYILELTYPLIQIECFYNPDCSHHPIQKADAWAFSIGTDKPNVFGPRNIHVGESYESVLNKFPGAENPIERRADGWEGYVRVLYGAVASRPYGHVPCPHGFAAEFSGHILYDQNQHPTGMVFFVDVWGGLSIQFKDGKVSSIGCGVILH